MFRPFKIRNLELKNRFVRSATWDGTADEQGGVTEKTLSLYKTLAEGNIGLIITGHMFVDVQGMAATGQHGIYQDDNIPGFRRLTRMVHDKGGKMAVQISHAGISMYPRDKIRLVVSPVSDIDRPQQEMKEEDILYIINRFSAAARRAVESGFDAIQIHGAHGYLVSQFLSPLYNHRTDTWGGTPEKRSYFLLELIKAVRKAVGPDFPLYIKLGVSDDDKDGLQLEEGVAAAKKIAAHGIDSVEVSVGFGRVIRRYSEAEIPYFREYAAAVKKAVSIPVMEVGGIRSLKTAQEIVNSGDADLISMCRPFIREPGIISRWWKGNDVPSSCTDCNKCLAETAAQHNLSCHADQAAD